MKRAVSLFLSFLMVFSLLPVNALAEEMQLEPVEVQEEIIEPEDDFSEVPDETIIPEEEVFAEEESPAEEETAEPEDEISESSGEVIVSEEKFFAETFAAKASGTCGDNLTWVLDTDGTLTISGSGAMTNFYSNTNAPWYNYSSSIKKLVIKEGVTSIGNYAFANYNNTYPYLAGELVIPDSVTRIGSDAFWKCEGFTGELKIPGSVTTIGAYAFSGCHGFTGNLVIPDSVTTISEYAFNGCNGLSGKAVIGKGVKTIKDYAFRNSDINHYYFKGNAPTVTSSTSSYSSFDNVDTIYYLMNNSTWTVSSGKWSGYCAKIWNPDYPDAVEYGNCGDNLEWQFDIYGTLTISGTGKMTDFASYVDAPWYDYRTDIEKLVIKDGITHIGSCAFDDYYNISGVLIIPDSVTSMGKYAFYECEGFTDELVLSNSVTDIGEYAFYLCRFTGELVIPDSVTTIRDNAFQGCDFTALKLGKKVETIGNNAFYSCEFTGELVIPDSVTFIGGYAFGYCDEFTGELVIPDSVTSIGGEAFSSCEGFSGKAIIGTGLEEIGNRAFRECGADYYYFKGDAPSVSSEGDYYSSFDSTDTIYYLIDKNWSVSNGKWNGYPAKKYSPEYPEAVEFGYCGSDLKWYLDSDGTLAITGTGAMNNFSSSNDMPWYNYKSSITKLVIEEGVTSIGNYAFYDCDGFTGELIIPDSVTSIGDYAFYNCNGFSSKATIGSEVATIGSKAFYGCSANEYYVKGDAPSATSAFDGSDIIYYSVDNATWSVSSGKWNGYYTFPYDYETGSISGTCGDNLTWVIDDEGVLTISGRGAMADYTSESAVPWYAVRNKITKIVLPNGITNIGDNAFRGFTNASCELVIPRTVENIGKYAFYDGGFTGELKIPDSITEIGDYAFYDCDGFTGELVIPDSVTTVGSSAFAECGGFAPKATIESGVTTIGSSAFKNCVITEFYFEGDAPSASAASASSPSFDSADAIYFPKENGTWSYSSGKWNGYTAFMYDMDDETIFGYCGGNSSGKNLMWALDTEGTLTVSGSGTMANYTSSSPAPWNRFAGNIKTLAIESGVTSIGTYAFYNTDTISGEIVIPDSVTSIGASAFENCDGLSAKITIGKGVTSVGDAAFRSCSVTDYYFRGKAPSIYEASSEWASFDADARIYFDKNNTSWTVSSGKWNGYYAYATDYETGTIYGYCGANTDSKNIEWSLDSEGVFTLSGTGAMRNYNSDNSPWYSIRSRIKTLVIGEGITVVGRYAFYDCDEITCELVIPETVTTIGRYAFSDCGGFAKKATIGSEVSEISDKAFELCSISEFYFRGDAPSVLAADDYYLSFDADDIIYYPKGNETWEVSGGKWNGYSANAYEAETGTISGYCGADSDGKNIEWSLDSEGVLKISGTGAMKDYSAGEKTPWNIYTVNSVVFEEGITHIGNSAFNDMENVSGRIYIPESVTSIGTNAFSGCGTSEFHFAGEEPQATPAGSASASFDESDVIYYSIEKLSWNISEGKWKGCSAVIYDPNHPEYIAMGYCGAEDDGKNLVWHIDGEYTLTISREGARAGYTGSSQPWKKYKNELKKLVLEDGITDIGENAFYEYKNLSGELIIPDSVTEIGQYAFFGCAGFTDELAIPDSVTAIETSAFAYTTGFTSLDLGSGLETIGNQAFYECSGFGEKVIIPASVKTIGILAFAGCSINDFYFEGSAPSVTPASSSSRSFDSGDKIYYSRYTENWPISGGSWNGYTANMYDPDNSDIVVCGFCGAEENGKNIFWYIDSEGTITFSGEGAMKDYSYSNAPWYNYRNDIKALVFEEGITRIGSYAFYSYYDYIGGQLVIPGSVTSVGSYAFYSCEGFAGELVIPDSVTSIGNWAFGWCTGLTSLKLGRGLETIGNDAFYNCNNIKGKLVLPESLVTIDSCAFQNCHGINGELVIPDSVKTIVGNAFQRTQITSAHIGSGVETIGNAVFDTTYIKGFTVSEENPNFSAENGVLFNKDKTDLVIFPAGNRDEYTIPESVKTIKNRAFYNCYANVVINHVIENIEGYAFYYSGSQDIYFMNGAPASIENYAFNGSGNNLYYLKGTEDKWTFDENGLWNGYTVTPFELNEEVEFDPNLYVASGYCGDEPFGGKNMAWTLDSAGTLRIFGKGTMQDYDQVRNSSNNRWISSAPWGSYYEKIKAIVIEEGITNIGNYAFYGLYNATAFNLPESLISIGLSAFSNCNNLSGKLVIPEGVVSVGDGAFVSCQGLTSAKLPSTLTFIGTESFLYSGVSEIEVAEENEVYSSASGALLSKDGKTLIIVPSGKTGSFNVPETVEIIENEAVLDVNIKELVLPESVKTIKSYAINGDLNIIVEGVLSDVESNAISGYGNYYNTSVYFMAGAPQNVASNAFNGNNVNLYYLKGTEDKWTFDENGLWNGYTVTPFEMGGEVEFDPSLYVDSGYCGKDPFGGKNMAWTLDSAGTLRIFGKGEMQDYEEARLPNGNWSVTSPWAKHYSRIKSIVFEEGITSIGVWAFGRFYDYSGRIDIPDSVTHIGDKAFLDCENMSALTLGEGVEYIGHQTFSYCYKVTAIYIPANIKELNGMQFQDSGIKNFTVSKDNEYYCSEDGVVFSKDKKELVIVPYGRTGSYTVPEFVETIGYDVFCDTGITEVVIPENVKTIEGGTFFRGNSMNVIFMGRPSYIGYRVFLSWDSSQVFNVYFMSGAPESIDSTAFDPDGDYKINLYYLSGTEDLWNFDSNGLWYGYEVKPFDLSEEAEIPDGNYIASGYCGGNPLGGKNIAWTLDEDGVLRIFGSGNMVSYSRVQGNNGSETSAPWGKYTSSIKEIIVEEGITEIGAYSFFCLSGTAELPESLESIAAYAFSGFGGTVSVNSRLENVANYAFNQWSNESVSVFFMAGSPLAASQYAFNGGNLYYLVGTEELWNFDANGRWNGNIVMPYSEGEEAEIPDGDYIDSGYCGLGPNGGKNMAWMLDSEGTLTIKGSGLMNNFSEIRDESGIWVSTAPWYKYYKDIKKIVIEDGIGSIGDSAFYRMQWVEEMPEIPGSVKSIGYDAFSDARFSGELVLPEGLVSVDDWAFGWQNFSKVVIPSTLSEIGNYAFYGPALEEFEVAEENPWFCEVDGAIFSKDKKNLVLLPNGKTGTYEIPEGTESIEGCALINSYLSEIIVPESVKTIKNSAFSGFSGNVIIEGSSVYLENWAFETGAKVYFMNGEPVTDYMYPFGNYNNGNSNVADVYYLSGTEDLWNFDSNGLWYGYEVKPFDLSEETEIPDGDYIASGYCGVDPFGGKNLGWTLDSEGTLTIFGNGEMQDYVEAQLSDGVWGSSAPWGEYYKDIKAITIEEGVENIGEFAFYRIVLEEAPVIAETVKKIESWAFCMVTFDGEVVIPEGTEYIAERAFSSSNIESVSVPSTVKEIEDQAFGYSNGIRNINVSENNPNYSSVDGILCDKSGTIIIQFPLGRTGKYTIPDGITTIGAYAFWNSKLNYIVVPENVKVLEDSAFYNCTGTIEIQGQLESIGYAAFRAYNTMKVNVIFMNGEPLSVYAKDDVNRSFSAEAGGTINIYYAKGTGDKWTFDEEGFWYGYTVKEFANYGDINLDETIDIKDVYYARLIAAKLMIPTQQQIYFGDVDGDGKVTAIDANYIRKFAAKIIDKFPVER